MSGKAQVLVVALAIISTLFVLRLVRRRQLRAKYSFLWLLTGLAALVLAAFPALINRISLAAGVAYPPTLFFLIAIAVLLLVVIHFSWELSRLEERTRALAEDLAILRAERDGPLPAPASSVDDPTPR